MTCSSIYGNKNSTHSPFLIALAKAPVFEIDEELHVFCEIYSFTFSKPLRLDSLKMSFSPGDLIWAKVRGYSHWPARVSSIYFEIKADESWAYVEVEWKLEVL